MANRSRRVTAKPASKRIALFIVLFLVSATGMMILHKADLLTPLADALFSWGDGGSTELVRIYPADTLDKTQTADIPDADINTIVCSEYSFEELVNVPSVEVNQSLLLVNTKQKIPDDFPAEIIEYNDTGVLMNRCITDAYAELSKAVREKFDTKLYVSSSYRTAKEQADIIIEVGPETATEVGASEHQTGLALDVYVAYYSGDGFIDCDAGKYVNESCTDYGFIIRYPKDKVDITGIRFEPWHIRYVGKPHSQIIGQNGVALEEYIESYEVGAFYAVGDYVISRQKLEGVIRVPDGATSVTVSPDNMGNVFITAYYGSKEEGHGNN